MSAIKAMLMLSFLCVSSANAVDHEMVHYSECRNLPDAEDGKKLCSLIVDWTASDSLDIRLALSSAAEEGYVGVTKYLLERQQIPSKDLVRALKGAEEKGKTETALLIAKTLLKRCQDHSASSWFCSVAE